MAQYRQKYRTVMKEVNQWSNKDVRDLHSLQPAGKDCVRHLSVTLSIVNSGDGGLDQCISQSLEDCSDNDCAEFASD